MNLSFVNQPLCTIKPGTGVAETPHPHGTPLGHWLGLPRIGFDPSVGEER